LRIAAGDFSGNHIRVDSVPSGWTWSGVVDQLTDGKNDKSVPIATNYHL